MGRKKAETNLKYAEEILNEAGKDRSTIQTLIENRKYKQAVELAQHCIELSFKSLFVLAREEFKYEHAPIKELSKLLQKLDYLEDWHKERIARVAWICEMWAPAHTWSVYGYLPIMASKIFEKKDAKIAKDYADEVGLICWSVKEEVRRHVQDLTD